MYSYACEYLSDDLDYYNERNICIIETDINVFNISILFCAFNDCCFDWLNYI
jgi:hypothetical protein